MKWSRYNTLFQSKRNGWLLFNSASRNFLKVEDNELAFIQEIARDPEKADYSASPMLYMQLRTMGFIVEDSADDDLYNIIRMRALTDAPQMSAADRPAVRMPAAWRRAAAGSAVARIPAAWRKAAADSAT